MSRKTWLLTGLLALPLATAGVVFGPALVRPDQLQPSAGYICPLTGEELPCPKCCPLNRQ